MPVILFLFLFLAIVFYPSLHFILPYPNMNLIRAEYALIAVALIFFGGGKTFKMFNLFKVEFFLVFSMLILSMFGLLYQSIETGYVDFGDMMIIPRLFVYCCIVLFAGVTCFSFSEYQDDFLLVVLLCSVLILITVAQYYNLFGVNQIFRPFEDETLALDRMKNLDGIRSWRRAVGFMGNPNYWGLAMAQLACIASYRLFWRNRLLYAPILLGLMGSIWLTGSRAALVSYVGAVVIGGGLIFVTAKKRPGLGLVGFVTLLALVAIARPDISDGVGTSERYSLDKLQTLELRVAMWGRIWEEMSDTPISFAIGQGSRETTHVGYADNNYIKILRENGLIVLTPYLFLLWFMIRRTLRLVKAIDDDNRPWPAALLMVLLAWVIFDLSADTWFGPRSMAVVLGLYAFVHTVGANRLSNKPIRSPVAATDHARDFSHG